MSREKINRWVGFLLTTINKALRKEFFNNCSKLDLLNLKLESLNISRDLCDTLSEEKNDCFIKYVNKQH